MSKHSRLSAIVAASAMALVFACGGESSNTDKRERTVQRKSPIEKPLPSVVDDKPSMTAPAPVAAAAIAPIAPAIPAPVKSYGELVREGKQLAKAGELDDALVALTRASELKPKAATPRIEIARVLISLGRSAEARAHAEAAVAIVADSSYGWNTLGRVELSEGNVDAAITSFERAAEENPDNSYAWNNLGFALIGLERYEEAVTALEMATSGSKPRSYMWNNLGMACEHLDRIVEARAAYRQAADSGSEKAASSLARLEGVVSLEAASAAAEEGEGASITVQLDAQP